MTIINGINFFLCCSESIEKEYVDADSLLGAHLTYDDNIHDSDDGQEDVKFLSLTPITDTETYNER